MPPSRRRLDYDLLAGPAGVFRSTRHDHAELGRHDIEAFGHILADGMQRATAARSGCILDVDKLLDPRRVRRQRSTVMTPLPGPLRLFGRIGGLLAGKALGLVCSTSSSPSSNKDRHSLRSLARLGVPVNNYYGDKAWR